jgi:hypothetical protein
MAAKAKKVREAPVETEEDEEVYEGEYETEVEYEAEEEDGPLLPLEDVPLPPEPVVVHEPRSRRKTPPHQRIDAAPHAELESDLGGQAPWGPGPSPLEMTTPSASAFVEVDRMSANSEDGGFSEGSEYVGPMPGLPHTRDLANVIRRRFGGGEYRVRGAVNGKIKERRFKIGGPSRDPDGAATATEAGWPAGYDPSAAAYDPYQSQGAIPGYGAQQPPGYPPQPQYSPYGYPPSSPYQDPYGAGGYGGGFGSAGAMAGLGAYQQRFSGDADEITRLREEASRAREEARVEAVRREADHEKNEMRNHLTRIEAQLGARGQDSGGGFMEFFKLQMQTRAQNEEVERKRRQQEWDAQNARRAQREEEEKRERERSREAAERDRRDRVDREDRDRKERRERQDAENKWRERESVRQERQQETMMQMLMGQASKPMDMVQMMGALKEISSPPKNMGEELGTMVETMAMIKDMASDKDDEQSKAERLIRTVGETVTPAIGEIAAIFQGRQQPQQIQQIPQQPYPVHPEAPHGAIPLQSMAQQQPVHALPAPQGENGVTYEQWGQVLKHIVDARDQIASSEDTARDLFTTVKVLNAIPIIPELAGTSAAVLRGKVNLLVVSRKVEGTEYHAYAQRFLEQTATPEGMGWLNEILAIVTQAWAHIQARNQEPAPVAPAQRQVIMPQQQAVEVQAPRQVVMPQQAPPVQVGPAPEAPVQAAQAPPAPEQAGGEAPVQGLPAEE